jgi:hypothetical protein
VTPLGCASTPGFDTPEFIDAGTTIETAMVIAVMATAAKANAARGARDW